MCTCGNQISTVKEEIPTRWRMEDTRTAQWIVGIQLFCISQCPYCISQPAMTYTLLALPSYFHMIHRFEAFLNRISQISSLRHLSEAAFGPEESLRRIFLDPKSKVLLSRAPRMYGSEVKMMEVWSLLQAPTTDMPALHPPMTWS